MSMTFVDVAVWLECTMNRVSDGDRSTSLSFLSCGALQSEEIIGILKVLFRYVEIGTRLALTSMDWMNTREAVILVPDPIALPIAWAILVLSFVTRRLSTISPSTSSSSSGRASLVSSVKTRPRGQCVFLFHTLMIRRGHHPGVGAAQEEQGWRRRAL